MHQRQVAFRADWAPEDGSRQESELRHADSAVQRHVEPKSKPQIKRLEAEENLREGQVTGEEL